MTPRDFFPTSSRLLPDCRPNTTTDYFLPLKGEEEVVAVGVGAGKGSPGGSPRDELEAVQAELERLVDAIRRLRERRDRGEGHFESYDTELADFYTELAELAEVA